MVKKSDIPKDTMSPFRLARPLAEIFKARTERDGLSLAQGYEKALSMWLASPDDLGTQAQPHCPPGMALVPSVPLPAVLHKAFAQEADIVGSWPALIQLAAELFLDAKHRKPREYEKPVKVVLTPEEKRAATIKRLEETGAIRYANGYAPVIGGVVFKHRPPHPRPWELIGLDSPVWDSYEADKRVHPEARRLFAEESARIEAEKRERWDKELEEAHKRPSVLKSGPIQGCATLLALEVEALKAGKPVSSVVMLDFTAKQATTSEEDFA